MVLLGIFGQKGDFGTYKGQLPLHLNLFNVPFLILTSKCQVIQILISELRYGGRGLQNKDFG